MALSQCSGCGRRVSYRHAECPWCGTPTDLSPPVGADSPPETAPSGRDKSGEAPVGWTHRGPFGFLRRHWNGEYSLARSYWANTFLIALVAPGMGLLLFPLVADRPARFSAAVVLLVTALGYASWFWSVRGTWISATKQTAAGRGWGRVARVMIVLGALRIAGELRNEGGALAEQFAILLGKQLGPQYRIRPGRDAETIRVAGGMNDGAADALAAALERAPGVKTVIFDSGGGWVREGRLVAAVISGRGLQTHVDGECSSACTLAFLAGKERTLGPHGRLGFHQVRSIGRSDLGRLLDIGRTRETYQSAGLPPDFVERVAATPSEKIWYPTVAELRAARVITRSDEWNAARAGLASRIRGDLEGDMKSIHVPEQEFTALLDCEVTAYIQWLNTTPCAYLYDQATTTLDWHLRNQKACLEQAGAATRLKEIDLQCTKLKLPNEWSIFEGMFARTFAETIDRRHPDSPTARRVGACAAGRYVTELDHLGCKPMDVEATTREEMFAAECIHDNQPLLDQRMRAVFHDCSRLSASGPGGSRVSER